MLLAVFAIIAQVGRCTLLYQLVLLVGPEGVVVHVVQPGLASYIVRVRGNADAACSVGARSSCGAHLACLAKLEGQGIWRNQDLLEATCTVADPQPCF